MNRSNSNASRINVIAIVFLAIHFSAYAQVTVGTPLTARERPTFFASGSQAQVEAYFRFAAHRLCRRSWQLDEEPEEECEEGVTDLLRDTYRLMGAEAFKALQSGSYSMPDWAYIRAHLVRDGMLRRACEHAASNHRWESCYGNTQRTVYAMREEFDKELKGVKVRRDSQTSAERVAREKIAQLEDEVNRRARQTQSSSSPGSSSGSSGDATACVKSEMIGAVRTWKYSNSCSSAIVATFKLKCSNGNEYRTSTAISANETRGVDLPLDNCRPIDGYTFTFGVESATYR